MTLLWAVAVTSLLVALIAVRRARATARRLEQLSQMYWELKYQHGELRAQLQRGTSEPASDSEGAPLAPAAEPVRPEGFIPLSSLKR
jgi:hypothetical protein